MARLTWRNERRKVQALVPADYNPRKITAKEREDLEASIQEFDEVIPVAVNVGSRKDVIIGGHQRVGIYAALGRDEIDVRVPSRELTLEEEQRLNLRLNKNTGGWDFDKLNSFSVDLLLDVGFGEEELAQRYDDVDILDDRPNAERRPKGQLAPRIGPGESLRLGDHVVTCGEITPAALTSLAKRGKDIDLVHVEIPAEAMNPTAIRTALSYVGAIVQPPRGGGYHALVWCDAQRIREAQDALLSIGGKLGQVCMWISGTITATKSPFAKAYEPCVTGWVGKPYLGGDPKTTAILNREVETDNQLREDVLAIIDLWADRDAKQSYDEDKSPTVYERALKRTTRAGSHILALHVGTGALLMAAEQTGRRCLVIDQDALALTAAVERWESYTGQKARKA